MYLKPWFYGNLDFWRCSKGLCQILQEERLHFQPAKRKSVRSRTQIRPLGKLGWKIGQIWNCHRKVHRRVIKPILRQQHTHRYKSLVSLERGIFYALFQAFRSGLASPIRFCFWIARRAMLFSTFSNLPNNSFTSIFAVFPSRRGVVTLQVQRCLRGLDGRTRSSLAVLRKIFPAPCGCEVFVLKNLVRPNLYTEKPLKRNDRYDRKTHKKNVG